MPLDTTVLVKVALKEVLITKLRWLRDTVLLTDGACFNDGDWNGRLDELKGLEDYW